MTLNLDEILSCINGKLILEGSKKKLNKVSIDTRNIIDEEMFLAISGENFDGNRYVINAIKNGVKLCIVDKVLFNKEEVEKFDASIILVENTMDALSSLAIYVRSKLNIDIIGITGSVGKTTTKDIIYDFLSSKYNVYKNPGNLNNHLGMPISLINIDDDAQIGIFELGMSGVGEIDYLASILKPNIAVITNIGVSHIEFLKSRQNILNCKLEITNYFNKDSILILNNDDEMLKSYSVEKNYKIYRVGSDSNCDFQAENINLKKDSIEFSCTYLNQKEDVVIQIVGKHNVLNSSIALKICEIFNIPIDLVRSKFNNLYISPMRQEIFKHNNMVLINDCYNASPDSMKSGIDVMMLYDMEKVCILGDMLELGNNSEIYHEDVGNYASGKVDKLIAIGKFKDSYCKKFKDKSNCFCFENFEDFELNVSSILKGNEIILIKASRSSKFEKVINIIMDKF